MAWLSYGMWGPCDCGAHHLPPLRIVAARSSEPQGQQGGDEVTFRRKSTLVARIRLYLV